MPVPSSCKHTILTFFSWTAHPESDHHQPISFHQDTSSFISGYPQNHCLANQHTPKQWMNTHNRNIGHQIIACIMTWWPISKCNHVLCLTRQRPPVTAKLDVLNTLIIPESHERELVPKLFHLPHSHIRMESSANRPAHIYTSQLRWWSGMGAYWWWLPQTPHQCSETHSFSCSLQQKRLIRLIRNQPSVIVAITTC